jgi:hypothetical protein
VPSGFTGGDTCCESALYTNVCPALAGGPCLVRASDCYGGTCAADSGAFSGTCTCVGPKGDCTLDSDCCAGATRCVANACQ